MKKKIIIIIIILVLLVTTGQAIYYLMSKRATNNEKSSDKTENIDNEITNTTNEETNIKWDEISQEGVNEELLFKNINVKKLESIATLLQSLSKEISEKEKEDIDFVLSAGWYKYTLDSPQFNEVINMGNSAIKPLYWIIYKSSNQGSYEYICAMALSKLVDFDDKNNSWSTSKEFLEKFNQKIISNRER